MQRNPFHIDRAPNARCGAADLGLAARSALRAAIAVRVPSIYRGRDRDLAGFIYDDEFLTNYHTAVMAIIRDYLTR